MAKTRKTREDKIRSAARIREAASKQEDTQTSSPVSFTYKLPTTPIERTSSKPTTAITHTHISQDLTKTLFITSTIVIAQVLLFVLLQNR